MSGRSPYSARLADLLEHGDVCGHDLVAGELLIGDKGGRHLLLADYALMHQLPVVSHDDVVQFVHARVMPRWYSRQPAGVADVRITRRSGVQRDRLEGCALLSVPA